MKLNKDEIELVLAGLEMRVKIRKSKMKEQERTLCNMQETKKLDYQQYLRIYSQNEEKKLIASVNKNKELIKDIEKLITKLKGE